MIISCAQCNCRFRIDDAKVPTGSFKVSCPKCQTTVSASGAATSDRSALAAGKSPATSHHRQVIPAPLFRTALEGTCEGIPMNPASTSEVNQLASTLINLFKSERSGDAKASRPTWDHRRVLVCTAPKHREQIALSLTEHGYEVFVADDTQQAVERMRESRVDIVILDSDFDPAEQGAAFVIREVNILRPAERRRLFFVCLSSSKRMTDAQAAFLQNVNLIVNSGELEDFPRILDRALRDFNELYKDFNVALNVSPL